MWKSLRLAIVLAVGLALVTALLGPDLRDSPTAEDYLFEPVVTGGWQQVVGLMGVVVIAGAGRALWRHRASIDRPIIVATAFLGAYLGATYRVTTAPTIGANIGGGMMLLFTPVPVIAWFATVAPRLASSRSPDVEPPPAATEV